MANDKKEAPVSQLPTPHAQAHHDDFHAALSNAMKTSPNVKQFVHLYEPHEYSKMKTFLSPDKASGYAVKEDGDIVSVFSTHKGRGDHIMAHALQNGGTKLDAYDGYLPKFYEKHGFKEYKREPNWTPGGPDVVYMHKPAADKKMAASENYLMSKAEDKARFYKESKDKVSELMKSEQMQGMTFMAYDGDNAGRLVGRAILADDAQALHDASNRIAHGHDIVRDWVKQMGGSVISGGGDEGTFVIPPEAIHHIEDLRKDYQYATNLTMTVGVGQSLSQAGKALMVGKFRGKDQVCHYDESIETELSASQAHLADGTATEEEQKLGEAYLTPEGAPMKESEDSHADCQYCAELAQDNVQDEDHCTYCHNDPSEGVEPHCQYCAEADQANAQHDPNAEGHDANCEYCQAAAQPGHEHSEENCQYCAAAESAPTHDHTGDDCQYCAESSQAAAPAAGVPVNDATGDQSLQQIAQEIEQTTQPGETPKQVLSTMDGPEDMPGTEMQDNVSHPANYQTNAPGDMGMAESAAPEAGPDLTQVLAGGLDNHADNIQREKVVQMVSEALQGFKACKPILERSQQQAPQLYSSSIAMLKAMIEMAKMLGLAPAQQEQQPGQEAQQPQASQEPQSESPHAAAPAHSAPSEGAHAGKPVGR